MKDDFATHTYYVTPMKVLAHVRLSANTPAHPRSSIRERILSHAQHTACSHNNMCSQNGRGMGACIPGPSTNSYRASCLTESAARCREGRHGQRHVIPVCMLLKHRCMHDTSRHMHTCRHNQACTDTNVGKLHGLALFLHSMHVASLDHVLQK